jgi:hypothetical protein
LDEDQLEDKINNLKLDYQRIIKEKDLYKEDLETMKTKHNQVNNFLLTRRRSCHLANIFFKSELKR